MTILSPTEARAGLADLRNHVASGTERSVLGRQGAPGSGLDGKRALPKREGARPGAA